MDKYFNKNKIIFLVVCFGIFILTSCNTSSGVGQNLSEKHASQTEHLDPIEDILFQLKSFVANKYYNYENKKIIKIFLKEISSNYREEPLFSRYLYDMISKDINDSVQFEIVPAINSQVDAVIDIHVIKDEAEFLKLLLNVVEPKDDVVIYSNIISHQYSEFDLSQFCAYKTNYAKKSVKKSKLKDTCLTVKAINIGDAYKESDKYYLHTHYSVFGGIRYRYLSKKDTGFSGFYAAEQQCVINGKVFNMNSNQCFYNDKITPGRVELIASFKAGRWDAYNKQQILSEGAKKKFYLNIKPNDHVTVDVYFIS